MANIYPVITLHQPWATWIMRGWKTIETRTHSRFASLEGKTILIHAGMQTDIAAFNNPYLTQEELVHDPDEIINGYILGSAYVTCFSGLLPGDARRALIECETKRFGLGLTRIEKFKDAIPAKGSQGIWYYDLDSKQRVPKP